MIVSIKKLSNQNKFFILISLFTYSFLAIYCLNHCYFWDTVQQISKEAHWFYINGFKTLIIPDNQSEYGIFSTGYHPPLMGIMTALLWKIFGYNLWVSHVFIFIWALILIYNLWKLVIHFFNEKYSGLVLFILLIDVTILSQFSISSPDFIILTAFIISIRAILEKKPLMLSVGLFFLACLNIRGVIAMAAIFISHLYYEYLTAGKKVQLRKFLTVVVPYLPVIIVLTTYYFYYLSIKGWFFVDNQAYGEHYANPGSWQIILKNILVFLLRSIENGRIIIWILFFYFLFFIIKSKDILSAKIKFILCNIILLYAIYLIFAFTTKMPFSSRYFLPQFTLVTLITLLWTFKYFNSVRTRNLIITLILIFRITGHFWIYPDRIAQEWDGKLTHLPYYELRKECFMYIDENGWDYNKISGGGCFYGDRGFTELSSHGKIVNWKFGQKYFIYSNISNNNDVVINTLQDKTNWKEVKRFEKWPVHIILYEKLE